MRLATCNALGSDDGLTNKQLTKIGRIARNHADVIGFQELKLMKDKERIRRGLSLKFELYNEQTSVPIALRNNWTVLDKGFSSLHSSHARVTPKRYVSWVIAQNTNRKELSPVAFTNIHLINKGPKGTVDEDERELREVLWNNGFEIWMDIVLEFTDEGITVFPVGDFNKQLLPHSEVNRLQWFTGKTIDKIGVIYPRHTKVRARKNWLEEINTPSDHHMKVASLRLFSTT